MKLIQNCVCVWLVFGISTTAKMIQNRKKSNERNVINNCKKKKRLVDKRMWHSCNSAVAAHRVQNKRYSLAFRLFLLYFSYFVFLGFCFLRKITIALGFSSLKKQYHIIFFLDSMLFRCIFFICFVLLVLLPFYLARDQNRLASHLLAFLDSILMAHQFRYYHFLNYFILFT